MDYVFNYANYIHPRGFVNDLGSSSTHETAKFCNSFIDWLLHTKCHSSIDIIGLVSLASCHNLVTKWTNNIRYDSKVTANMSNTGDSGSGNGPGQPAPPPKIPFFEKVKAFPKWLVTMVFIFLALGTVGLAINSLGLHTVSVATLGNIPNLTFTMKTEGLQTLGFLASLGAIVGGIVTFFIICARAIGIFFHVHADYEPKAELKAEIKKKMRSLRIVSAIITGILSSVIILIGAGVLYVFTGVDALNLNSFISLFASTHYLAIVVAVIIIAATGWCLKYFMNTIEGLAEKIHGYVPKPLKKLF